MAKNYIDNLTEEVKKGLREKAEQGHWPTVAPRRLRQQPRHASHRGRSGARPLVARLFELYATGEYSAQGHHAQGIRDRPPSPARRPAHDEIRDPPDAAQRLIYTGDFLWLGKRHTGSHDAAHHPRDVRSGAGGAQRQAASALPEAAARVHGTPHLRPVRLLDDRRKEEGQVRLLPLHRLPRRLRQHLHPRGAACRPARERRQAHSDYAGSPTTSRQALRRQTTEAERRRRQPFVSSTNGADASSPKLDRGYDDYVTGKISEEFWTRKSEEWEAELARRCRTGSVTTSHEPLATATAAKILELAKQAEFLYKTQNPAEQRRLLETVLSNCTFDRGSLCPTYR